MRDRWRLVPGAEADEPEPVRRRNGQVRQRRGRGLQQRCPAHNVIADFLDEGLLRDIDVDFGTPGSGDPTPPPNTGGEPSTPPAEQPRHRSAPSKQQVVKTAGPSLVPAVTTARPASISKARIKKTKKGRFLMVRVTSDKDSATLSVRLVAKKTGKVYKKVSKSIATNRTVKVMKLPKRARTGARGALELT